jgi:hypothetical protein
MPGPVLDFKLFLRKIFAVIVTIFQNTTIRRVGGWFSAYLATFWTFSAGIDQFLIAWRSPTGQVEIENSDDKVSIIDTRHRQKVDEGSGLAFDENLDLRRCSFGLNCAPYLKCGTTELLCNAPQRQDISAIIVEIMPLWYSPDIVEDL